MATSPDLGSLLVVESIEATAIDGPDHVPRNVEPDHPDASVQRRGHRRPVITEVIGSAVIPLGRLEQLPLVELATTPRIERCLIRSLEELHSKNELWLDFGHGLEEIGVKLLLLNIGVGLPEQHDPRLHQLRRELFELERSTPSAIEEAARLGRRHRGRQLGVADRQKVQFITCRWLDSGDCKGQHDRNTFHERVLPRMGHHT